MDEPEPRMTRHLASRYTQASDMAAALYCAIDETGLRIPPRRDIARHGLVSEATISRRFRDSGSSESRLVTRLVTARRNTHPRGPRDGGWDRWLPADEGDLRDVRVWLSCLALAAYSPTEAEVVRDAWEREREELRGDLERAATGEVPDAQAELLHLVVAGLSLLRALDPQVSHEQAMALLERAVAALT